MEKHYNMIAIQRQQSGKILLTTLDGWKTFVVGEENLNRFGVSLGDMVEVTENENGILTKHRKIETPANLQFKVVGKNTIVYGDRAKVMSDNNRTYFNSSTFGKMNCFRKIENRQYGEDYPVRIKYRIEQDRSNNMPFNWDAYIDETLDVDRGQSSTLKKSLIREIPEYGHRYENVHHKSIENVNQSSNPEPSRYHSTTDEECTEVVEGIVVYKNAKRNFYLVWTKDSYPGNDVKLVNNMGVELNVSDWIKMHMTRRENETYFPFEPTPNTPKFECKYFTKIVDPRLVTVPTKNNNSVMVTIPNFVKQHVAEDDVYNNYLLGRLIDEKRQLVENGTYEITVIRKWNETSEVKKAVWFISKAEKKETGSRSSSPKIDKNMDNLYLSPSSADQQRSHYDVPRLENKKPITTHTVVGIVVAKNQIHNDYYVWTKDAYPGKDVILRNNQGINLKVSDWVQMEMTKEDFDTFFPQPPKRETSRYKCESFEKIEEPPLKTVATWNRDNVKVTIPNFKRVGETLYHDFLGYLRDDKKHLEENGTFELTVTRISPTQKTRGARRTDEYQTTNGKPSVWHVISAEKVLESVSCTGVITSIKKINGKKQYTCWLINQHCLTYINDSKKLSQGDFFISTFERNVNREWEHFNGSKIIQISNVMESEVRGNSIKFEISVKVIGGEMIKLEHAHFGTIIDKWERLPKYVLHGELVRVNVTQEEVDGRVCWIVCD